MAGLTGVPAATIDGVVRNRTGTPIGDAVIAVVDAPVPMPDIAALSSADGRFTLSAPAPGFYTVHAAHPGHQPARVTVEVVAGGLRTEVTIVLDPE